MATITRDHTLTIDRHALARLRAYAFVLDRMRSQIETLLSDAAHGGADKCEACSLDGDYAQDALAALIDTD